ncbi:MAG: hypothetical protein ACYTGQ_05700, partial [Planctomycetota bacterium]
MRDEGLPLILHRLPLRLQLFAERFQLGPLLVDPVAVPLDLVTLAVEFGLIRRDTLLGLEAGVETGGPFPQLVLALAQLRVVMLELIALPLERFTLVLLIPLTLIELVGLNPEGLLTPLQISGAGLGLGSSGLSLITQLIQLGALCPQRFGFRGQGSLG